MSGVDLRACGTEEGSYSSCSAVLCVIQGYLFALVGLELEVKCRLGLFTMPCHVFSAPGFSLLVNLATLMAA